MQRKSVKKIAPEIGEKGVFSMIKKQNSSKKNDSEKQKNRMISFTQRDLNQCRVIDFLSY